MSYYAGFNIEKDQFILFDDTNENLFIGDNKIKTVQIKCNFNKFKNENTCIFKIDKNHFNELSNLNQYHIVDNIKNKNRDFLCKYNLEEWII